MFLVVFRQNEVHKELDHTKQFIEYNNKWNLEININGKNYFSNY